MASTPGVGQAYFDLQTQLDALRNAIGQYQDIISNPLTQPAQRLQAQQALEQNLSTQQSIQQSMNSMMSAPADNRPFDNSPGGIDSVPLNDYLPGETPIPIWATGNPPASNPGTPSNAGIPNPAAEAMAIENSEPAKQYTNTFVGDTENIPDPNYVPSNDFPTDFAPPSQSSSGGLEDGDWESLEYATDYNAHHGKFKFLFKVKMGGPWQFYVKSATKPKVKMVHQDVNYYNFRSKVLTQVTFDPMTIVLWDEIGNSVNKFFATYLSTVSGQGSGNWGTEKSFDSKNSSSSSKSYRNQGFGDPVLATVIIEQVFANGTKSNRFIFKNARIESMDLDDLTMDSSEMNSLAITFNYDAIECITVDHSVIHTDPSAAKDLLRGGGAAGPAFGANDDGRGFDPFSIGGAGSPNIPGFGNLLNTAESIFANAVPSIGLSISANSNGVNVNVGGGIPGLSGGVTIGPNGVAGGVSASVPGFNANLGVGPGGVVGGISGGVPGVGGALTFGPGGIAGTGGVSSGPLTIAGVFNPNGVSASAGVAMSSPISVMSASMPPIGSLIPESSYVNNLAINANVAINNLVVQPFNVN